MKDDLLITINVDKEPYIKEITNDNIINITGESGSGKSTYVAKHYQNDDYIVIDTDEILSSNKPSLNKDCLELWKYINKKYGDNKPRRSEQFNIIYKDILDYYKETDKTLVIDSAQFRNLINSNSLCLLKGKLIVIRTCIDNCYQRCLSRWIKRHPGYSKEEYDKYAKRKLDIYKWYKSINQFIIYIDKKEGK